MAKPAKNISKQLLKAKTTWLTFAPDNQRRKTSAVLIKGFVAKTKARLHIRKVSPVLVKQTKKPYYEAKQYLYMRPGNNYCYMQIYFAFHH